MALWGFWILILGVIILGLGIVFELTIKDANGVRPTWPIVFLVLGGIIVIVALAILYVQFDKTRREIIMETRAILGQAKLDLSCEAQLLAFEGQKYVTKLGLIQ